MKDLYFGFISLICTLLTPLNLLKIKTELLTGNFAALQKSKKKQSLKKVLKPKKAKKVKEKSDKVEPLGFLESFPLFQLPVIHWLVKYTRFVGWIMLDILRTVFKLRDKRINLFGIWCFVGLPGYGKTVSLVYYLDNLRRKYGDKILIITNFYYKGQDMHLKGWEMLLDEYDKPVIFAWDELQNEFNSRNYRNFPMGLVHEITQCRKGHGKQIVYTTQTFTAVDNNFRNLTKEVVDCRTYFGRLTKCKYYKRDFYIARTESNSIDKKLKIKPYKRESFIQTDYLRSRYDSFQRLDYLKDLTDK